MVKSRPIIMEALIRAKQYAEEYIKSRETLSLVNYFRTGVFIKKKVIEVNEKGEAVDEDDDE